MRDVDGSRLLDVWTELGLPLRCVQGDQGTHALTICSMRQKLGEFIVFFVCRILVNKHSFDGKWAARLSVGQRNIYEESAERIHIHF